LWQDDVVAQCKIMGDDTFVDDYTKKSAR
jgi:hypothetical protein